MSEDTREMLKCFAVVFGMPLLGLALIVLMLNCSIEQERREEEKRNPPPEDRRGIYVVIRNQPNGGRRFEDFPAAYPLR